MTEEEKAELKDIAFDLRKAIYKPTLFIPTKEIIQISVDRIYKLINPKGE